MGDTTLIFGNANNKEISSKYGDIVVIVDAFIKENVTKKAEVTSYPIEDGSIIADHMILLPIELTLEGIVGNVSLHNRNILSNISNNIGAITNLITGLPVKNRVVDAFNKFEAIMDEKWLVNVVTGLRVFKDMSILEFNVDRNADNGGALVFTMILKQVKIVVSQTSLTPSSKIGGDPKTKLQAQPTKDVAKTTSGQTTDESLVDKVNKRLDTNIIKSK